MLWPPKQGLIDLDNPKGTTVADHQAVTGNAAQIEFWNSAATRAWADQYARMDRAVAALTKELLDLAAPRPGERVLDIGCARRCPRGINPLDRWSQMIEHMTDAVGVARKVNAVWSRPSVASFFTLSKRKGLPHLSGSRRLRSSRFRTTADEDREGQ